MSTRSHSTHNHGRLVSAFGLAVAGTLFFALPRLEATHGTALASTIFRLAGVAVFFGSLYALAQSAIGRALEHRRALAPDESGYDFGWSWGAMYGPWVAAAAILSVSGGLQLLLPSLWPAWFALALLGVNAFAGGLILRASKRSDVATLPLVELVRAEEELVLDAGCGGGRTTLALAKVLRGGRVVAVDRFDAYYIDGGGRALLQRNLRLAGLTDKVQIERGDLTQLPFPSGHFDSAVSAHVLDHMKRQKQAGLAELHRVLKPGGRLLMVVWVPGWVTFSLANVFCLLLTSRKGWRTLAHGAGFAIRDEGTFNGMWFAVLENAR